MNKNTLKKGCVIAALSLMIPAAQAQIEHITNGGFETGDFTGWTISNSGSGAWVINDGSVNPPGPGAPLAPISGSFDAISIQGGPGLHLASECVAVPTNVTSAILSWDDRIRNHAGSFSDPNQEWRVLLLDESGAELAEIYSTNPGDDLIQVGPNSNSADITALLQAHEGESVCVSFEEQDNLFYFNVSLDNVSLLITSTIDVAGCDTGIEDRILADGSTLSSLISALIDECAEEAKNHGAFVKCVAHGLNDLKKADIISGEEKGILQSCAAESSIGK